MILPNGTSLSIINEVGTSYEQFGILLLKDDFGKRVEIIEHDERKVARIITQIFREWLEGKGLKQTWETLLKVLRMMGLEELANNVECSVNHMLLSNHDHEL